MTWNTGLHSGMWNRDPHVCQNEVHGGVCLRRQLAVCQQAPHKVASVSKQPLGQEPAAERLDGLVANVEHELRQLGDQPAADRGHAKRKADRIPCRVYAVPEIALDEGVCACIAHASWWRSVAALRGLTAGAAFDTVSCERSSSFPRLPLAQLCAIWPTHR